MGLQQCTSGVTLSQRFPTLVLTGAGAPPKSFNWCNMRKSNAVKVSIPELPPIGFRIAFNEQEYTCTGSHIHKTRAGYALPLIDWSATCGTCGGPAHMTSKLHDLKPSRNCAGCRSKNVGNFGKHD